MAPSEVPLRLSFVKRLLKPTPTMLLVVAGLAFAGALFFGQRHIAFLTGASVSDAEIISIEAPSDDYARYAVRLLDLPGGKVHGIIESDRRHLTPGVTFPVLYLHDTPNQILSIELFVPWTRAIWLTLFGLAALLLGMIERDRQANPPTPVLPLE
jgi:hypothetical protein